MRTIDNYANGPSDIGRRPATSQVDGQFLDQRSGLIGR